MEEEMNLLTPLQIAFNDGVEAAKAVIRETEIGDYRESDYWRASLINAIARKVNPYSYGVNVPDCNCDHPSHKLNHLTPIEDEVVGDWVLNAACDIHKRIQEYNEIAGLSVRLPSVSRLAGLIHQHKQQSNRKDGE